jgi:predicted DsbA family dithiol-disulfide isomerase
VPFFVFNRKVSVSGAQDAEVLLEAMEQALEEQGGGRRAEGGGKKQEI